MIGTADSGHIMYLQRFWRNPTEYSENIKPNNKDNTLGWCLRYTKRKFLQTVSSMQYWPNRFLIAGENWKIPALSTQSYIHQEFWQFKLLASPISSNTS